MSEKLNRPDKGLLIVFGCSWTVGEWLPGWSMLDTKPTYAFSEYSWPSLLGRALNMEVMNMGRGGNANRQILHDILKFDNNFGFRSDDLAIVTWSFFGRELLLDTTAYGQQTRTRDLVDLKNDLNFYMVHSDNDLQIRSKEYVHHADCFFKSRNMKYKMARIERWLEKNENWTIHTDEDLLLFEQIDYAADNAHPGIESNKRFFEKMLKEING